MNDVKLLPCPFCDRSVSLTCRNNSLTIECDKCKLEMRRYIDVGNSVIIPVMQKIVYAWNTRGGVPNE